MVNKRVSCLIYKSSLHSFLLGFKVECKIIRVLSIILTFFFSAFTAIFFFTIILYIKNIKTNDHGTTNTYFMKPHYLVAFWLQIIASILIILQANVNSNSFSNFILAKSKFAVRVMPYNNFDWIYFGKIKQTCSQILSEHIE